jgi:hypothetical protein
MNSGDVKPSALPSRNYFGLVTFFQASSIEEWREKVGIYNGVLPPCRVIKESSIQDKFSMAASQKDINGYKKFKHVLLLIS